MSQSWTIAPAFRGTLASQLWPSLKSAEDAEGQITSEDGHTKLKRLTIGEKFYFIKEYLNTGGFFRSIRCFKSRPRLEWENLFLFQHLGIPTPEMVGFGESYNKALFQKGVIITEGVPEAFDLHMLAHLRSPFLQDPEWFNSVLEQVADYTRRLHDVGFVHVDLKWRNILTEIKPSPVVYFFDCPNGRFLPWPLLERGIIKDLACLDKVAKYHLSAKTRLKFYKLYRGIHKLSSDDKQKIRKILQFFDGRE